MSARLLDGKTLLALSDDELAARFAGFARIVVDLGAGDGKAALRLARAEPQTLVVAIDATPDRMLPQAVRSRRKPSRGGADNVLFLIADVAALPGALDGRADALTVTLPWAGLLRAVVLADETFLRAARRVLRPRARLTIVLNLDALQDRVPRAFADLPRVDADYARGTLAERFSAYGLRVDAVRELQNEEKAALGSAWAKRLTRARNPRFLVLEAVAAAPSGSDDVEDAEEQQRREE